MQGIKWRKLVIYDSLPSTLEKALLDICSEARRISSTKQDESDSRRTNYSPASGSAKRALETWHSLHSRSSTRGTLAPCPVYYHRFPLESVTTGNEGGAMFNARQKETDVSRRIDPRDACIECQRSLFLLVNEKPRNRVRGAWKNGTDEERKRGRLQLNEGRKRRGRGGRVMQRRSAVVDPSPKGERAAIAFIPLT